ncbi:MAG: hypothetical protein LBE80_08040 [Deltaproteobacteria bacterium]|jgi:acyl transferase domain-containing protein|nr:hypothetical protein [Deltaproteobacteria bacterium]
MDQAKQNDQAKAGAQKIEMSPREKELTSALARARSIIAELSKGREPGKETATGLVADKVAIIGLGCLFPAGAAEVRGLRDFYHSLLAGLQSVLPISEERLRLWRRLNDGAEISLKRAALLKRDLFSADLKRFGLSPAEGRLIDPHIHLSLEVVLEALEDAGLDFSKMLGSDTGVFFGRGGTDFLSEMVVKAGPGVDFDPYTMTGNLPASLPGRISHFFDFQGPSILTDTACSTSLTAVVQAVRSLQVGECSLAVAGASNLIVGPKASAWLLGMGALAPDGRTKAFSDSADGFGRGEGAAALILKRLTEAQRDGDRILGVVYGAATSANGSLSAFTVTSAKAQEILIKKALKDAALSPEQVAYVETHGTGTAVGDPIEAEALISVYGQAPNRPSPLLIGSVKSNIGHLEAAAGAASLIKALGALQFDQIPPSLLAETKSRLIDWSSGISLVQSPTPWPSGYKQKFIGISSFGITGSLVHLILGQPPSPPEPPAPIRVLSPKNRPGPEVKADQRPALAHNLYLSAWSESALGLEAEVFAQKLTNLTDFGLMARSSGLRRPGPYRLALTAQDIPEALGALESYLAGNHGPYLAADRLESGPKSSRAWSEALVFFYGSPEYPSSEQAPFLLELPSYLRELSQAFPVYRESLKRLLSFKPELAFLWDLIFNSPEKASPWPQASLEKALAANDLTYLTANNLATLYAVHQLALTSLLFSLGLKPSAVMGFGLGETTALAAASLFDQETALEIFLLGLNFSTWPENQPGQSRPGFNGHCARLPELCRRPKTEPELSTFRRRLDKISWGRLRIPYLAPLSKLYLDAGAINWPDYFMAWAQKPLALNQDLDCLPHPTILEIGPKGQWNLLAQSQASVLKEAPAPEANQKLVLSTLEKGQSLKRLLFSLARLWTKGALASANPTGPVCPQVLPPIRFERQELDIPWPENPRPLEPAAIDPPPEVIEPESASQALAISEARLGAQAPFGAELTLESPAQPPSLKVGGEPSPEVSLSRLQLELFLEVCREQMARLGPDQNQLKPNSFGQNLPGKNNLETS